jgi:hypothetical protein
VFDLWRARRTLFGPEALNQASIPLATKSQKVVIQMRTAGVQQRVLERPLLFLCFRQLNAPPLAGLIRRLFP